VAKRNVDSYEAPEAEAAPAEMFGQNSQDGAAAAAPTPAPEPAPPTASGADLGAAFDAARERAEAAEGAFRDFLIHRGCVNGTPYKVTNGNLYTVRQVKGRKRVVPVNPQSD
jgi:hypothetical protein